MKKTFRRLTLNRETLHRLEPNEFGIVVGAAVAGAPASSIGTCCLCSEYDTCRTNTSITICPITVAGLNLAM